MINQMQNWWDRPLDLVKPQCKFYRFAFHNINLSLSHHFSLGKIWRVASRIVHRLHVWIEMGWERISLVYQIAPIAACVCVVLALV